MKAKHLFIFTIAACFVLSGCGDNERDDLSDFKPEQTISPTVKNDAVSVDASGNSIRSQGNAFQLETDTSASAQTISASKLFSEKLIAAEKTYANGTITLSGTADPETGLVIVTLTNNFKSQAKLFGNPTIVTVDGKSVDMDPYDNMHATAANVQPGTTANITFIIPTQYIKPVFKLSGELWAMGLFSDRQYSIEFQ